MTPDEFDEAEHVARHGCPSDGCMECFVEAMHDEEVHFELHGCPSPDCPKCIGEEMDELFYGGK